MECKTFQYGSIIIDDAPGLKDKLTEILEYAELQHPNDLGLQDYVIGEQLKAFVKISELKAQLKIGESDESGACQL